MGRIAEKTAVVTGGARGIGRAVCRLFVDEGAAVAVTDIVDDEGRELAAQIEKDGGTAAYWHLDTTSEANIVNVFAEVHNRFGDLDARHPLGHVGEPDEVAYGALYLASEEAKFVTGSELVVDGGYTAQ